MEVLSNTFTVGGVKQSVFRPLIFTHPIIIEERADDNDNGE
jgi:hypothetical protein